MKRLAFVIILMAVVGGAVYAFRAPLNCLLYLRAPHDNQVAFSQDGDVYVVSPESAAPCRILEDSALQVFWSPDRTQIGLVRAGESSWEIAAVQPDGTSLRTLAPWQGGFPTEPSTTWSADGSTIIYRSQGEAAAGIFALNLVSGETQPLTSDLIPSTMAVSSTQQIAFVTYESALYTINTEGSDLTHWSDEAGDLGVAWSPDGEQLAFVSSATGALQLLTPATAAVETLLPRESLNGGIYGITWSPDGEQLLVQAFGEQLQSELYLFDIASRNLDYIAEINVLGQSVNWFPDGVHFTYRAAERFHIGNAESGETRILN